ncbi:MAG TPA: DUF2063 domain-containing protein, partial [Chromatiales bacterium]|nr:DUF2063 domain-containing protein [Chromatiales bacterium]
MRADFHHRFAEALSKPGLQPPDEIAGSSPVPAISRFNVYRNNVRMGLIEALADGFPVVLKLVGDAFFHNMAGVYAANEWPQSPVMLEYGAGFADFIDSFEPAATLPYLADIARLEWAWHSAWHAADAPVLDRAAIADVDRLAVERLVFELHPSVQWVCSSWPVVSIWEANAPDAGPEQVRIESVAQAALLTRPHQKVQVRRLPDGAATFISALKNGLPLLDAARQAADAHADFDLALNL